MERAGRILSRLRSAQATLTPGQLAAAAWTAAVGARLAAHTRVITLDRGRLIVEAEDPLWQKNLASLSAPILSNLRRLLGEMAPRELDFRLGAPRRPPLREPAARPRDLFSTPTPAPDQHLLRRKAGA